MYGPLSLEASIFVFLHNHGITMWERPSLEQLQASLADPSLPIGQRMRAAYYLRQVHSENEADQADVVDALVAGLHNAQHGSLMRHEFAYVLGQLRDERACEGLEKALTRDDDCVMVRHEAAEALGAIGAERSRPCLESLLADPRPELSQTCQLALNVMNWRRDGGDPETMPAACACMLNPYSSVDPAPPHPSHADLPWKDLGDILCDSDQPLFERYRAMFSLRNRGGKDAVLQLCRALVEDISSALLRHEVAYVLGQLQHPASVEALEESLRREDEHQMVRHESAEALGAIDGRWEDVERILSEFLEDKNDAVRESCLVALDSGDYWGYNKQVNDDEVETPVGTSFAAQKNHDASVLVNHFNIQA